MHFRVPKCWLCTAVVLFVSSETGFSEQARLPYVLNGSDWNLYGSALRLNVDGPKFRFTVLNPDHFLSLAEVRPGSVLIEGTIHGSSVSGTASMFDRRCGSLLYEISGSIDLASTRMLLNGSFRTDDFYGDLLSYFPSFNPTGFFRRANYVFARSGIPDSGEIIGTSVSLIDGQSLLDFDWTRLVSVSRFSHLTFTQHTD